MTTPRDALATALFDTTRGLGGNAEAILAALHAAGWTVARTEHARDGEALARLRDDLMPLLRRHSHDDKVVLTRAGDWRDCRLCRVLVDHGFLALDDIGAGTREAIEASRGGGE